VVAFHNDPARVPFADGIELFVISRLQHVIKRSGRAGAVIEFAVRVREIIDQLILATDRLAGIDQIVLETTVCTRSDAPFPLEFEVVEALARDDVAATALSRRA
jgi:hypothetical protein